MAGQAKFQSLSGFWWGFCWERAQGPRDLPEPVSIPFRVLVGFLHLRLCLLNLHITSRFNPFQGFGGVSAWAGFRSKELIFQCFNPFQGFGGVSASFGGLIPVRIIGLFQSLSGFWWGFCPVPTGET